MLASSVQAVVVCNANVPRVCTLVLFITCVIKGIECACVTFSAAHLRHGHYLLFHVHLLTSVSSHEGMVYHNSFHSHRPQECVRSQASSRPDLREEERCPVSHYTRGVDPSCDPLPL